MDFPRPIPGGSMSTGYSGNNINTNVSVPGAPYLASNLDQLLMGALTQPKPQAPVSRPQQQMQALAPARERAAPDPRSFNTMNQYGPTPKSFGKFMMNQTGNWGHFVDAADIPAGLQGKIAPGFYGGVTNWDTSNPMISGHAAYGNHGSSSGGGNYGAAMQAPQPDQSSSSGFDYLPKAEQLRYLQSLERSNSAGG